MEILTKKPARLRIPASEVKAGDVVWFSYNDGESWSRQGVAFCTPTVTISFGNFHSGVKSVRAIDELVEVERANG
jgi:hypothetical protein